MASSWSPMLPLFSTILLWLLLIVCSTCLVSSLEINQTLKVGDRVQKMKMIKKLLHKINKPAEKTIKSPDGDIIDCVLFYKQPAFDHPLLKGEIPMEPPEPSFVPNTTGEVFENFQLWNANGEGCPKGTIPIRRTTKEEVSRATSVARIGMKPIPNKLDADDTGFHEYAIANVGPGQYTGVSARLNVWAPQVAGSFEFSLSQLWAVAGSSGIDLNSLEAGWQVYPFFYADNHPRLFIVWTADSYNTTGCYNLKCPGFVQTNNKIVLGGTLSPVSSYNGPQYDVTLTIRKDPKDGNWWLLYGPSLTPVGYWPSTLVPLLKKSATIVTFGGEIVNTMPSGGHTTTQMGSGHFPGEGFKKAAFVGNLQVLGLDFQHIPEINLKPYVTNSHCYDLQVHPATQKLGPYFFFGGPGKGPGCP